MDVQRLARLLQDKEQVIRETILDKAQEKNLILYGARGFNLQVPMRYRKKTSDYDVLSQKPKKTAKEIAATLSRRLEGDVSVKPATHKGTWKVSINGENIVDVTQLKFKPKTKRVWGTEVRSLKSIKRNAKRLSNNPKMTYRKSKDDSTLAIVAEIERIESIF